MFQDYNKLHFIFQKLDFSLSFVVFSYFSRVLIIT